MFFTCTEFSRFYGVPVEIVREMLALARKAKVANERYCDGRTSHPEASKQKRSAEQSSQLYRRDFETYLHQLDALARPHGFTGVTCHGLRPDLVKGDKIIDLPISDE